MRIAMAAQTLGESNGPGVFTARLARALAGLGHEVRVFVPSRDGRPRESRDDGVVVHALRSIPLARKADVWVTPLFDPSVARLVDAFGPDVVHLQDHYPTSKVMLRASLARGLPVVATNHFVPENFTAGVGALGIARGVVTSVLWRQALAVLSRARVVVAPTRNAAERLVEHGLSVPVEAISCGVDVSRFERAEANRAAFGLPSQRRLVGYVGRLDREKEVELLVATMARLARDDVQLVLAGAGRDEARLRRLASPLGERVRFLGHVPQRELPALLKSLDVFAMPCRIELQSIATLEAMSASRPVLAANGGALPELVGDGVNGALFRPGDAADAGAKLAAMLDSDLVALGRASRARAAAHDLSQTVRRYEQVYERATGERSTFAPP